MRTPLVFGAMALLMMVSLSPSSLYADDLPATAVQRHPSVATKPSEQPQVAPKLEDVIAKWHFVSLGNLYTDGENRLLCVETDKHKGALWNPVSNTLSVSSTKQCEPDSSLRLLKPYPMNGTKLTVNFEGRVNSCADILNYHYTVTYPDGDTHSFYLVKRLETPTLYGARVECGSINGQIKKVSMAFDVLNPSTATDLGHNELLLYSYDRTNGPVLIRLPAIRSDSVLWSTDHDLVIIPESILHPLLIEAGDELFARYNALLRVIGEPLVKLPDH